MSFENINAAAGMEMFAEKVFLARKPKPVVKEKIIIPDHILFDFDSSVVKPMFSLVLEEVAKILQQKPNKSLVIEGHTDSFGGDDSNQKLSQERAESVQQYMINAMRIPTYRLIATGYGETRPVASNETQSGRERNRRIDIVIRPNLEAS